MELSDVSEERPSLLYAEAQTMVFVCSLEMPIHLGSVDAPEVQLVCGYC